MFLTYFQADVPTPDDVVAVSNLLDQMTALLEMEQTMLDNLQGQEDEDLDGSERIGMNPLQQVWKSVNIYWLIKIWLYILYSYYICFLLYVTFSG